MCTFFSTRLGDLKQKESEKFQKLIGIAVVFDVVQYYLLSGVSLNRIERN